MAVEERVKNGINWRRCTSLSKTWYTDLDGIAKEAKRLGFTHVERGWPDYGKITIDEWVEARRPMVPSWDTGRGSYRLILARGGRWARNWITNEHNDISRIGGCFEIVKLEVQDL